MTNTLPGYEVPEEELRTCSKCNKTKTLDNFSTGINFGKSRHRHECKSCAAGTQRAGVSPPARLKIIGLVRGGDQ